jgi:lipoprotein signal peptidase
VQRLPKLNKTDVKGQWLGNLFDNYVTGDCIDAWEILFSELYNWLSNFNFEHTLICTSVLGFVRNQFINFYSVHLFFTQ